MTAGEAHALHVAPLLHRRLLALEEEAERASQDPYYL